MLGINSVWISPKGGHTHVLRNLWYTNRKLYELTGRDLIGLCGAIDIKQFCRVGNIANEHK